MITVNYASSKCTTESPNPPTRCRRAARPAAADERLLDNWLAIQGLNLQRHARSLAALRQR